MAEQRVTALALGGKLDGSMIDGTGHYASAYVFPRTIFPISAAPSNDLVSLERADYVRRDFRWEREGRVQELTFWVDPLTIHSDYDVMLQLARGYHPVTDLNP